MVKASYLLVQKKFSAAYSNATRRAKATISMWLMSWHGAFRKPAHTQIDALIFGQRKECDTNGKAKHGPGYVAAAISLSSRNHFLNPTQ
jgi:hypothetical protein